VSSPVLRSPGALAVAAVQGITPYVIGKPISELTRELGVTDIVKLASNENPLGPSPLALAAAQAALADTLLYPDGNGFDLKDALARHHGISTSQVTLGNGSNDVAYGVKGWVEIRSNKGKQKHE